MWLTFTALDAQMGSAGEFAGDFGTKTDVNDRDASGDFCVCETIFARTENYGWRCCAKKDVLCQT